MERCSRARELCASGGGYGFCGRKATLQHHGVDGAGHLLFATFVHGLSHQFL